MAEKEYRLGSHTVYDLKYHVVWVTKYRYKVLTGEIAVRARDVIRQVCMAREIRIIKGLSNCGRIPVDRSSFGLC